MDNKLENNDNRPVLDVNALRNLGIERIRQLSGSIWNDYNASDPGITIIEALCFSIMDLGYRMTFDIRDLLTEEGFKNPLYKSAFYEPYRVLSSAPLTIDDYRKLILENIQGVKNVWLRNVEKEVTVPKEISGGKVSVKGFYEVFVDLDEKEVFVDLDEKERKTKKEEKEKEIEILLHKNRNLCEDFVSINTVEQIPVGIEASIEVEPDVDYVKVIREITKNIAGYVSPELHLYSIEEMLEKGKSVSDIFTGPLPIKGYVDMDEIENMQDNRTLYASDVINIIMQVEGVSGVRELRFFVKNDDVKYVNIESHKISLKEECVGKEVFRFVENNAVADKNGSYNGLYNNIDFFLNDFRFSISLTTSEIRKETKKERRINYVFDKDTSKNRNFDQYFTFQDSLPNVYLVGRESISSSETDLRKAQRLQLKGYLLFFDQLLADFLMRLNSAKYVLSWEKSKNLEEWNKRQLTYLHRILTNEDVNDLKNVVDPSYEADFKEEVYDEERELKHKSRALNSLLARFGEDFVNFSIMQFISQSESDKSVKDKEYELICSKSSLLDKLPILGYRRAGAIDYHSELSLDDDFDGVGFDDGNYYPIERKLSIKFGLETYNPMKELHPKLTNKRLHPDDASEKETIVFNDNRKMDYHETFGLHVIEHNLLLPDNENDFLYLYKDERNRDYSEDPYSMMVTVVLPGWLDIVQNHQFRDVVENAIAEEFPAHIAVKICWIGPLQMYRLEKAYFQFLDEKADGIVKTKALHDLVDALSKMKNIYHKVQLSDNNKTNKTLLGYSTLESTEFKWSN